MKLRPLLLGILCVSALSACACPRPAESYHGAPYSDERTAGSGVPETGCLQRALPGL